MSHQADALRTALAGLDPGAVRRDVLAWYRRRGRALPWRERPTIYGVWISEIMLQQTTVVAVIPRWHEFLARFPDVQALASASEAEVLDVWSGLGYYRRARQLHAAARHVAEQLGGRFPGDLAGWRALPGVGDYTAGAVSSIALGLPEPAVDTNVDRVLRRLVSDDPDFAAALRPAAVRELARVLVDPADPGAWTQALMDLGAGPCAVKNPACVECPLASRCRARAAGVVAEVPARAARPATVPVVLSLLIAQYPEGVLMLPPGQPPVLFPEGCGEQARQSYHGLYRGFWRLPASAWYRLDSPQDGPRRADAMHGGWASWLRIPRRLLHPVGTLQGTVTHYRQTMFVFVATLPDPWSPAAPAIRGRLEDPERPLAQPDRRALALAGAESPDSGQI